MSQDDNSEPSNRDIIVALQGTWGQQKDLIQGVERRLGAKFEAALSATEERLDKRIDGVERRIDGVEQRLDKRIDDTEQRLREYIAEQIQDRPVVVHVDMGRVAALEKQVEDLAERLASLEARVPPPA